MTALMELITPVGKFLKSNHTNEYTELNLDHFTLKERTGKETAGPTLDLDQMLRNGLAEGKT